MTVGEAKSRMTYREAMQWMAYFSKHGYASQTSGAIPEVQRGFALLASILVNVNGGYQGGRKAKLEDFLPQREGQSDGSPEEVAALLSSLWSGKKTSDRPKKSIWRRASRQRAK